MIIDSHVDLAGFVASEPSFKRLENGTSTAKLRVAYTERRFNRETGEWADGPTSFVTVLCWRTLADNVAISLRKGEPVLVRGRLRVREYQGKDGSPRIAVEVDASSVGHDLSRGVAHFSRTRRAAGDTAAESTEALRASADGRAAGPSGNGPASRNGTPGEGSGGMEQGLDEPGVDEPGPAGSAADDPDGAGDGVLDEEAVAEFASELTGSRGGVPA
jgi:single-strand DNA-binding protein